MLHHLNAPEHQVGSRESQPASGGAAIAGRRFRLLWRVSGAAQIVLAVLSVVVFILDLIPLELQRRIVNDAIATSIAPR